MKANVSIEPIKAMKLGKYQFTGNYSAVQERLDRSTKHSSTIAYAANRNAMASKLTNASK